MRRDFALRNHDAERRATIVAPPGLAEAANHRQGPGPPAESSRFSFKTKN